MSRERMLGEICNPDDQVQYDGRDEVRIALGAQFLTEAAVMSIEGLAKYRDAINLPETDENTADLIKDARYDAILGLGTLQIALSKIAWVLRVDFDEAYKRCLEAGPTEEHPDLHGL
jgi:hypothetical protein